MEIHFEPWITPGYTWVFPVSDGHVNIGTGTFAQRVHQDGVALRDILNRFTADLATTEGRLAQAEPVGPVRGHPLRTRLGSTRTHAERVREDGRPFVASHVIELRVGLASRPDLPATFVLEAGFYVYIPNWDQENLFHGGLIISLAGAMGPNPDLEVERD